VTGQAVIGRAKKIDKRSIAKLLDVSPNTLFVWLKVRRPVALE
jgi:transposase-like protein